MQKYEVEFEPTETQNFINERIAGKTVKIQKTDENGITFEDRPVTEKDVYSNETDVFVPVMIIQTFSNGEQTSQNIQEFKQIAKLDEIENLYLSDEEKNVIVEDEVLEINETAQATQETVKTEETTDVVSNTESSDVDESNTNKTETE